MDAALLRKLLVEAVREHNVLPLTGRCNLLCRFCSHAQNPPGVRAYSFPAVDLPLLQELIPYLEPEQKIIIGESATRLREGEPFTHPGIFTVLGLLRKRFPSTLIQVTTNASLLDREVVRGLSTLLPLEVVLSLNSATEQGRRLLMGDPNPRQAVAAAELLGQAGVPFHGSAVAQPHLLGWGNLSDTLQFLDSAGARTIRLLLPGYTRCSNPDSVPAADTAERCRLLVEEMKPRLQSPLLAESPIISNLKPLIEGVVPGSPAARAELRGGDLILTVDGHQPRSRVEAYNLARKKRSPSLTALRGGRRITVTLAKGKGDPPGFVVNYDLDPAQVERVRGKLRTGRETLMLVSRAALARWRMAVECFNLSGLSVEPVSAQYFGGSINCAGLLTVSDLQAELARKAPLAAPDLVLLPGVAFDSGGRDMCGVHYGDLVSNGIAVALVQ